MMAKTLTIQLPDELEHQLSSQAKHLNISLEALVLQALAQSVDQVDEDNESKESVLEGFRQAWKEAREGRTIPIEQLWDGIDV